MADIRALAQDLRHKKTAKRRQAIDKLGASGDRLALKYLVYAYRNDPDEKIRHHAIQTIKKLRNELETNGETVKSGQKQTTDSEKPQTRWLRRAPTKLDNFLLNISILLCAFFVWTCINNLWSVDVIPDFYYVDLSSIPLADSTTFGSHVKQIQESLYVDELTPAAPGLSLSGIMRIVAQESRPSHQLFSNRDAEMMAISRGIITQPQNFYPSATVKLSAAYLLGIMAAIVIWVLIAAAISMNTNDTKIVTYRLSLAIGFAVARFIGRFFNMTASWIIILSVNLLMLLAHVWFLLFYARDFAATVVATMGIPVAPGYHVGMQLGYGFLLQFFTVLGAVFVAVIGLTQVEAVPDEV